MQPAPLLLATAALSAALAAPSFAQDAALAAASLAPGTATRIEAAAGASPWAPGWELDANDGTRASFVRHEETRHSRALVHSVALPPAAADESFAARAERHKAAEFATYVIRSVHFNAVGQDGQTCVRFDALLQPPGREGDDGTRITLQGWLCPHPSDRDRAVEAEVRQEGTAFGFSSPEVVERFLRDWTLEPAPRRR